MARGRNSDQQEPVLLSLFDRLIDHKNPEVFQSRSASEQRLEQSVIEDLSDLLNTRIREVDISSEYEEACTSIRAYGIPDFSDITVDDGPGLRSLADDIADAIRAFEPRLSKVNVAYANDPDHPKEVYYRVTAMLNIRPYPKPIEFDYRISSNSKTFEATRR